MWQSIGKALWRSGGSVVAGVALSAALATPWGMAATPVLSGMSKGLKKSYEQRGLRVPAWVGWLPF